MSLFSRIKNIIKSNLNFSKTSEIEIDLNSYKDFYFDDSNSSSFEKDKEKEYYKILEVEYGSGLKEIKKAYKKLLKKYHPDLFINNQEKLKIAQKLIKKINEAYNYFERKFL
ncbi:MAG: DnaJ domain-containing protein [Candidatus Gastranaerophilales bacterium]|nr:DnaJ domain-containing protein [Candidatus Gastranaerophilales bacterium]